MIKVIIIVLIVLLMVVPVLACIRISGDITREEEYYAMHGHNMRKNNR